jgi:hypothetical protein
MTISFVCPQGHPLTAPDDMAGRAGKCPHCGTRFLIPQREGSARSAGGSPAAGGSTAGTRSEQIVFFCPNGHKLNGPATLRGKLGLCPHCQTRFRIPAEPEAADAAPSSELVDEDGEVIEGRPLDEGAEGGGEGPSDDAEGAAEGAPTSETAETSEPETAPAPWQAPAPESTDSSRWLELTRWLWSQRDSRSAVELRLRNGSTLQPAWFSATLSDGRIGVFARQTEEGLYDIAAIAWEQIEQVDVRGCEELPSGLFE